MTKLTHGDTFQHRGITFLVTLEDDDCHAPPWVENDGHGEVTGWQRADYMNPPRGYWRLNWDRGSERLYNWRESLAIAKRDSWGLAPDAYAGLAKRLGREPTGRDIRKEAVRRDFEYLRAWCNDDWRYIGVIVEALGQPAGEVIASDAIWGVPSCDEDHIEALARDMAEDIARQFCRQKDNDVMAGG